MITKKQCVACQKKCFVGKVGEVQDHLCKKHLKEYLKEEVKMAKLYLSSFKGNTLKGTKTTYRKIILKKLDTPQNKE